MMRPRLISPEGLRAHDSGFDIDIRLPWYRTLPLSVVEIVGVKIDDRPVALDRMKFAVNGATHALNELRGLVDEWWYVLDSANLHVDLPLVQRGKDYAVEVTLALRPPYIPGFTRVTQCVKQLRAH